jgi:aromatic-L-amino-acid decarboxylase
METERLGELLGLLGERLDEFQRFEHPDAFASRDKWVALADEPLPDQGLGIDEVTRELLDTVIPGGSRIPEPTFWGFITTGPTTAPVLAATAAMVVSPQRGMVTAFNRLEERALEWLRDLCELPEDMRGVFSSGGSVANLIALGAARQWSFEQVGRDVAAVGVDRPTAVYASDQVHHTIQRSCAVLGLGRDVVRAIPSDGQQRMRVDALRRVMDADAEAGVLPIAVVGTAGTTNTGAIDPLADLATVTRERNVWFHVDGAYGLPGRLDPRVQDRYLGVDEADSVVVDPHKWLAAPVGVGATFVRDRSLLMRAFTQEPADYLEGSFTDETDAAVSVDAMGIPYSDMTLELSSPARGSWVWALLREQGREGLRNRVVTDNDYARRVTQYARRHPRLEALTEPELSVACVRYVGEGADPASAPALDDLNRQLLRQLVRTTPYVPTATVVDGSFAIRPCFINARTTIEHVDGFLDGLVRTGDGLSNR